MTLFPCPSRSLFQYLHISTPRGVVSKLLEHDALPHARDRSKQMPLHVALESGLDDIAAMLLQNMPNDVVRELFVAREVCAAQAECTLHRLLDSGMMEAALALLDCMLDKVGQTGHVRVFYHVLEADDKGRSPAHPDFDKNSRSCLHLISRESYGDIIFHYVVRLLIRRKWKKFARWRFQINSFLFLLTLLLLTFSVVVSVSSPDPTVYDSPLQVSRAVCEVWGVGVAALTLLLEINQFRKQRQRQPFQDFRSSSLQPIIKELNCTINRTRSR